MNIEESFYIDLETEGNTLRIMRLPQYIYVLQNLTDLSSDTKNFSVALVTKKEYERR